MMHFKDRHAFGVRLEREVNGQKVQMIKRFCRLFFGCKGSPYNAVQGMTRALELVERDRTDQSNPFHWASIALNLPCADDYNPTMPRVYKVTSDGKFAAGTVVYMDDGRSCGNTERECQRLGRSLSSRLNNLGQQDASRKRRPPSR